ncbi:probable 28S ribosomal protein S6, mitochondrial [Macrosteles quadrilineatus]|uniref:probable 28S ribosomal protein S6, mitochondrial n=1 Tax=Macrosteles quadrilineatus TaxID=74068 RepID=UPI0023E23FC5|nr:probable 28S ribosomal protein S6, mitochondrial [Macrosteles quadrilineatus]
MPTYELSFLVRVLPKHETKNILKRAANYIFDHGGIIRNIDNLGTRPTPYKISNHGAVHKEASYFVYKFDFPPAKLTILNDVLHRDVDIIKKRIFRNEAKEEFECTLEDEIKPAPYRKEVQLMIEEGRKKASQKKTFTYGNNLKINPFQR